MKQGSLVRVLAAMAVAGVVLGACQRVQPMYNVASHPVPASAQRLPLKTIEQTILDAAVARKWNVDRVRPGVLHAKQKWREHMAEVEIRYSQESYSIQHRSSVNLKEQGDEIHRSYNKLVHALEDEIERRLYRAGY
ncbi:hypothetical protein [Azospirillum sp.]|uniref:hypothetical protein n=1 Tax=Azospirillum sp. TaxID=34012 RepID=UPI002D491B15|nr:hypothetical protein [Azospirillum sp.]HYD67575.1 hypothetical protein [Azospirillum sp.]